MQTAEGMWDTFYTGFLHVPTRSARGKERKMDLDKWHELCGA
jgi:hypothetical protein